jgi:hypothetical protein
MRSERSWITRLKAGIWKGLGKGLSKGDVPYVEGRICGTRRPIIIVTETERRRESCLRNKWLSINEGLAYKNIINYCVVNVKNVGKHLYKTKCIRVASVLWLVCLRLDPRVAGSNTAETMDF